MPISAKTTPSTMLTSGNPQFVVEHAAGRRRRCGSRRRSDRTDRVLLEAAQRRAAAGEEALARRQRTAQAARQPETHAGGEDEPRPDDLVGEPLALLALQREVVEVLPEILHVRPLGAEPRRRVRERMRDERAARGVEHLVARLARERPRQRRDRVNVSSESQPGPGLERARPFEAVAVVPHVGVAELRFALDRHALAVDVEARAVSSWRDCAPRGNTRRRSIAPADTAATAG